MTDLRLVWSSDTGKVQGARSHPGPSMAPPPPGIDPVALSRKAGGTTPTPPPNSPSSFRPLVNNGDASVKSRWLWAMSAAAVAVVMGAIGIEMLLTGEAIVVIEIGLGRLVRATRELPLMRPLVAYFVGAEHLFFAAMLAWMSILLARDVPVPKATANELIIASSRQLRHVRIDWATKACVSIAAGFTIASGAQSMLDAVTRMLPAASMIPVGLFIAIAGVFEFLGLQYLVRAIAVYCIPALRSYLVVIAAPLQGGMANRICIGDGRLTRLGRQVIYHEDLISFAPQISRFRGRVLGLADLQIVFRLEGVRHAITLEAPASLKVTQLIADIVNGPWRVAKSRDRTVWQENSTSIVPPPQR
jgi:hypothetical protein